VDEGVEGEVWIRGYSVMLGLYKRERSDVFDPDGWYHTGDRGRFRDGWFFFSGRQGDLIKTRGANVAPTEVEKVLLGERGVEGAYVFGVDHPDRGQDVVALVVSERPTEELREALSEQLSSYKLPRHIFLIEGSDVSYLTSQKPDRLALSALARRLTAATERAGQ